MYNPTYMYISVQYYTGYLFIPDESNIVDLTEQDCGSSKVTLVVGSWMVLSRLSAFSTNVSMNSQLSRAFRGASLRFLLSTLS